MVTNLFVPLESDRLKVIVRVCDKSAVTEYGGKFSGKKKCLFCCLFSLCGFFFYWIPVNFGSIKPLEAGRQRQNISTCEMSQRSDRNYVL